MMNAARPRIIIYETGLRWSAAWRRCDAAPSRLVTVNSLAECRKLLDAAPASVVVAEFSAMTGEDVLPWLAKRMFGRCESALIIVGGATIEPWRWRLMEFGALLVVTSERQLPEGCRAARRQLQRWTTPELGFRERIWESLPWRGDKLD